MGNRNTRDTRVRAQQQGTALATLLPLGLFTTCWCLMHPEVSSQLVTTMGEKVSTGSQHDTPPAVSPVLVRAVIRLKHTVTGVER
jgi:hypothetical protein